MPPTRAKYRKIRRAVNPCVPGSSPGRGANIHAGIGMIPRFSFAFIFSAKNRIAEKNNITNLFVLYF